MGNFQNFRKPVTYILEQELRKKEFKNKINTVDTQEKIGDLSDYPCKFLRDSNKKVCKIVYGEDPYSWSEEFIRDSSDKVVKVKTIYPNGNIKYIKINKTFDGMIGSIEYVK